ncbi:MAG: phage tail tip lysozyme [Candidatus Nanopelagicales bacterium]
MKSRFCVSTALAVAATALVAGPASASVIAPPVGPTSPAVTAAAAQVDKAIAAKKSVDAQVAAAHKAMLDARSRVQSAPKSSKSAAAATKAYEIAQKNYAALTAAQAAAAKNITTLKARYTSTSTKAAADYRAARPKITAANLDRRGRRLAYKKYSVNPSNYLANGIRHAKPLGGIRLTTGSYRTTAVGIWYGDCSLTYSTPSPLVTSSRGSNKQGAFAALRRYGFSQHGAAAMVAVANKRSAMNPTQRSAGYGLLGWSDSRPLAAAAAKVKADTSSLSFQLSYAIHQVRANKVLDVAAHSASASNAVGVFAKSFGVRYTTTLANRANKYAAKYAADNSLAVKKTCVNQGMKAFAAKYVSLIGAATLRGWYDNRPYSVQGMCQKNSQSVWKMVGGGNYRPGITGNAVDVGMYMRNTGKLNSWSGYAPRGALVWWDNSIGGGYGHVAVSDGAGNFINNWSSGRISSTSFASLNVTPMGWADPAKVYGKYKPAK